jgi:hypothetical protein
LEQKPKGRRSIKDLQISLAKYLIELEEGKRLPSIKKLAASTRMSVGSVSSALNDLEDMGAVKIQKRGHLGSVVVSISLGILWNLVEQGPFVIAMTLPMHSKFEGLATGVKKAFEKTGIETYMIFIRGSRTRLKALAENRCHMAVMSSLTAEALCGQKNQILMKMPPGSWISGYGVFFRETIANPGKPLRVGIDPDSFDHKRLSEMEFEGQNVEFKAVPFVQFPRLLKNGEIDTVLWTIDQKEIYLGPGINYRPLSDRVLGMMGDDPISTAFVIRTDNVTVGAVLRAIMKEEDILEIQRKIVSGEMIPEY